MTLKAHTHAHVMRASRNNAEIFFRSLLVVLVICMRSVDVDAIEQRRERETHNVAQMNAHAHRPFNNKMLYGM